MSHTTKPETTTEETKLEGSKHTEEAATKSDESAETKPEEAKKETTGEADQSAVSEVKVVTNEENEETLFKVFVAPSPAFGSAHHYDNYNLITSVAPSSSASQPVNGKKEV